MEVIIVIAVVGFAYLLLQRQQQGPGAGMVAADLNRNSQIVAQQPVYAGPVGGSYGGLESGFLQSAIGTTQQSILKSSADSSDSGQASTGATVIASSLGIIGSVVGGLLAAHSARVAGATAENSGIDNIVPAIDADVKEINAAYRAGQITPTMAVTYLMQVRDQYWSYMGQFQGKPGVATRACPPGQVGGPLTILAGYTTGTSGCVTGQPTCDKTCTAGCCVGCSAINGGIANQVWAIQTGYRGPVGMCKVFGSKFGAHDRAAYQLRW